MARSPRRPRTPRPVSTAPPPGPARPLAEEVAELLGQDDGVPRWAGRPLPPMPENQEQLLADSEQVLAGTAQDLQSSTRSLQACCALGWMLLAGEPEDDGPVPPWLLDPDAPVDALDVIFIGATYPGRFRSPLEFSHARDAWLDVLADGPNRHELAQIIAAAAEVCAQLDVPVDSNAAWLALLLRMRQARIGQRPLAAAVMPRRALAGHRAIYGPRPATRDDGEAPEAAEALVAALSEPVPSVGTPAEALQSGLAVLVAARLDELVTLAEIAAASGPLDVGEPGVPGHGTAEEIQTADRFEARLNGTLAALEQPEARVAAHGPEAVRAAVDELGPSGLIAALRLGVAPEEGRGTAIRLCVPWTLGLLAGSSLIPVTDLLLRSAAAQEPGLVALARVCALPELTAPLQPGDVAFHGALGTALMRIAYQAGVEELSTSRTFTPKSGGAGADAPPPGPGGPGEGRPLSADDVEESLYVGLEHAGISDLTVRACRLLHSQPPVGRFLEPERQDAWEAAVAQAAAELGVAEADVVELREADDARWRQVLSVSALQQIGADPDAVPQVVAQLRDVVADLEPDDRLELVTGAEAAALAADLRFNVSLRAFVVNQPGWDVDVAVRAAAAWGDDLLAAEIAQVGAAVESDTRAAVQAASESAGEPHPVVDVGWSAVPALCVLFAVALASS